MIKKHLAFFCISLLFGNQYIFSQNPSYDFIAKMAGGGTIAFFAWIVGMTTIKHGALPDKGDLSLIAGFSVLVYGVACLPILLIKWREGTETKKNLSKQEPFKPLVDKDLNGKAER